MPKCIIKTVFIAKGKQNEKNGMIILSVMKKKTKQNKNKKKTVM